MAVATIQAPPGGGTYITTERITLSATPLTAQGVKIAGDYRFYRVQFIDAVGYVTEDVADGAVLVEATDDYETVYANDPRAFLGPKEDDVLGILNGTSFSVASPTASAVVEISVHK